MSKENGLTINSDVLAHKYESHINMGHEACKKKDFDMTLQHFKDAWKYEEQGKILCLPLKCAEMLYDQAEFKRCVVFLGKSIPIGERYPEDYKQDDVEKMRALQGKALRRLHGFDETFDTKPWLEFVEEDNDSFATMDEIRMSLGDIVGDNMAQSVFRMADFDGDGRANLEDLLYIREALNVPMEERSRIDFGTLIPRNPDEGPMDVINACLKANRLDN